MEALAADLRYAFRMMRKNTGFTAVAVAALALGIGANTAIFTVVDTVPKYMAWRQNQVFEALTVYDFGALEMTMGSGDPPQQVAAVHVSADYFKVFGAAPIVGRTFTEAEDLPSGPAVAVIGYGVWQSRLGGDRNVIGRPILLNRVPFSIVGILIYYTRHDRSEIYFVTSVPEPAEWLTPESWSAKGDVNELRQAYEEFHPDVRAVLDGCPECHKWAILERDPLPRWSDRRVVLLGDACHPMTPYMAQGAATAIEDAAVLARCIADVDGDDLEGAFRRYEAHRKPRTSRIQAISSANTWMKGGNEDTSWLYGYDAWTVPLTADATAVGANGAT